jgi:hypothetical protein
VGLTRTHTHTHTRTHTRTHTHPHTHTNTQVDVNTEVGVIHDYGLRELRLFTDYGRTSRPLFIVEDGTELAFKQRHLKALIKK